MQKIYFLILIFILTNGIIYSKVPEQDSLALVAIYEDMDGPNWINNTNWLSGPVSSWHGIIVTGNRVTGIYLSFNGLTGEIPSSIGNLSELTVFSLSQNNLSGILPESICSLSKLIRIQLNYTGLSGQIPPNIGDLTALEYFIIQGNNFSGTIPTSLFNLVNLKHLIFNSNNFTGQITSDYFNLTNLRIFDFGYNNFDGELPTGFSNLTQLEGLSIQGSFTGMVPLEIFNMSSLKQLTIQGDLYDNWQLPEDLSALVNLSNLTITSKSLIGGIPPSIKSLSGLISLTINNSGLTAKLPNELFQILSLERLTLTYNNFAAWELPSEISELNMKSLLLDNCGLTGSIPVEILASTNLQSFSISYNSVMELPDISSLSNLSYVAVQSNYLEFDDLEPIISLFSSKDRYSPQKTKTASVVAIPSGTDGQLIANVGGTSNVYSWYKSGTLIADETSATLNITNASIHDRGAYQVRITNSIVADLEIKRDFIVTVPGIESDSLALVTFYQATNGENWLDNSNWLSGNLSEWVGVTISNDRVTELALSSNNLNGSIPSAIAALDKLEILDLGKNDIINELPEAFYKLNSLKTIDLSANQLSGNLSASVKDLTAVESIDLSNNSLTDSIPISFNELANLVILKLNNNQFTWLPDLSISTINDLQVKFNRLTFEALEPNLALFTGVESYNEQAKVLIGKYTLAELGESIQLDASLAGSANEYQWYKDGLLLPDENNSNLNIASFTYDDLGRYYAEVTSTLVLGLTLETNNFELSTNLSLSERAGLVSFVIDDMAYITTGYDGTNYYNDTRIYDSVEDTFLLAASFPGVARREAIAFTLGGFGYVGLGISADNTLLNDMYAYNPTTNTWTAVANYPLTGLRSAVSFVINEVAYVGTGFDGTDETAAFYGYDATNNSWTPTADVPEKRQEAVAFSINGKGYISGGFFFDGFSTQLSDVQAYDPTTNTWTEKVFADIDLNFTDAAVFVKNDKAYISYGNQENISSYDPATDDIVKLGDLAAIDNGVIGPTRADGIAFAINGKAYFGFGSAGFSPTLYFNDLLEINLPNNTPTGLNLSNDVVNENQGPNVLIGILSAQDEDNDDILTFQFIDGNGTNDADNGVFQITGNELYALTDFDYESQAQYAINIEVNDGRLGVQTQSFSIKVNDINEQPNLEIPNQTFSVAENSTSFKELIAVSATDPDGNQLTFTITSGNDNGFFAINSSNGECTLTEDAQLNFEENDSYLLNIEVSDKEFSMLATITLNITDVNEAPELDNLQFSLEENSPQGTIVGVLSGFDPEGDNISYSIDNVNLEDHVFAIDRNTVIVENAAALDFETNQAFSLSIIASDGQLSKTAIIDISITDAIEVTGLKELHAQAIKYYPNPVKDQLTIEHGMLEKAQLRFQDSTGKIVYKATTGDSSKSTIDMKKLSAGVYILIIESKTLNGYVKIIK